MDTRLLGDRFPVSNKYNPAWLIAGCSGGANPLCSASENLKRIRDAGVDNHVYPIHAEARSLPFAEGFFDAVVAIDSFPYFGTDDHYLNYLSRFVKPGGAIGFAGAGLMQEIEASIPDTLAAWWEPNMYCLHSPTWWQSHWKRTGIVDVELADSMPDGWQAWLEWQAIVAPKNLVEIRAVESDAGNYLGYIRVVSRRRHDAKLDEIVASIPSNYIAQPLLRSDEARTSR